jgi:hypothetical protein
MVLPEEGVTFYAIPRQFGVPSSYRYAVVNDEIVLVDPVTREILDVIDWLINAVWPCPAGVPTRQQGVA